MVVLVVVLWVGWSGRGWHVPVGLRVREWALVSLGEGGLQVRAVEVIAVWIFGRNIPDDAAAA